jgi:hypothetical protein
VSSAASCNEFKESTHKTIRSWHEFTKYNSFYLASKIIRLREFDKVMWISANHLKNNILEFFVD